MSEIPTLSESRTPVRGRLYHPRVISDEAAYNRALGVRLRQARKARGLTQEKLARRLQLGRTSVVMIERGEQRVPAHVIVNLAEILQIPVTELLAVEERSVAPPSRAPEVSSPEVNAWVQGALGARQDAG
ncbi:MAG TPA: helix-turn-helix transcriptional regulator [Candidatus Limnocylindrales bacterium]|nr:helix-turn-helix transcriptional regulator [Candidatus Limnocylindrales bacterium]